MTNQLLDPEWWAIRVRGWGIGQFMAEDGDVRGRLDAETDVVAIDLDDRDHDVRPDHDLLRWFSAQYQHPFLPTTEKPIRTRDTPVASLLGIVS
jgi:hypothetical protein